MRNIGFLIVLLAGMGISVMALSLWDATGRASFTQIPSARLAKMEHASATPDVLADLGMNDKAGEPAKIDNAFKFGMFPAGAGNNLADAASVASVAGPAILTVLIAGLLSKAPRPSGK